MDSRAWSRVWAVAGFVFALITLCLLTWWLIRKTASDDGAGIATVLSLVPTVISAIAAVVSAVASLRSRPSAEVPEKVLQSEVGGRSASPAITDTYGTTAENTTPGTKRLESEARPSGVAAEMKFNAGVLGVVGGVVALVVLGALLAWWVFGKALAEDTTHEVAGVNCPIKPGPLALAVSGRQNSPGFVLSQTSEQVISTATDGRSSGLLTLIDVDGTPSVVKTFTSAPKSEIAAKEYLSIIIGEAATVRAKSPEVDVLSALDTAARVIGPTRPGTVVLVDSGLSTAGAVRFDEKTAVDIEVNDMVTSLRDNGALPDFRGLTVVFVGIGEVAPPQPALRPAQRHHLVELWTGIAQAGGAACVASIDQVRRANPPDAVPPVRIVPIPPPPVTRVERDRFILTNGSEVRFQPDFGPNSSEFVDSSAARRALIPVAKAAADRPNTRVRIAGTTANLGNKGAQRLLSLERAQAVASLLVELGVDPERLIVEGLG
ncbi:MAG: OmpA family protein, partial [Pseudonocardiaceae bacterium]